MADNGIVYEVRWWLSTVSGNAVENPSPERLTLVVMEVSEGVSSFKVRGMINTHLYPMIQ